VSLVVHSAPHLAPLGDELASLLADPLPDPFAAEVVSVPTAGVRDWLQRHLAVRLGATGRSDGVVANVRMEFPGRFVAAALGQRLDEVDPWEVDRLTWAVLTVLAEGRSPGVPRSALPRAVTARRIADLFDRTRRTARRSSSSGPSVTTATARSTGTARSSRSRRISAGSRPCGARCDA
jgi:exonuclease V gamma subunit